MATYNFTASAVDQPMNLLMLDRDSRRCSARLNEFAKLDSIGEVYCAAAAEEVIGMELETIFDLCIFSVEGRPARAFRDDVIRIQDQYGQLKIIATETPQEPENVVAYIEAGAWDYVSRTQGTMTLIDKLHLSANGQSKLDPPVTAALMSRIHELSQLRKPAINGSNGISSLTPREREVLALISQRMSNRQIAEELVLEVGTVKNHVHNLLIKLDADNRYEAAAMAVEPFFLPTGYSK